MLPMLRRELVEKRHWASDEELLNYYAIGQATPGIIAVNTATFIGRKQHGISGALAATAGIVFPSLIIISFIAAILRKYQDIPAVQRAFTGIRVSVCMLLIFTIGKLIHKNIRTKRDWIILILAFLLLTVGQISPILIMLGAALCGLLLHAKEVT